MKNRYSKYCSIAFTIVFLITIFVLSNMKGSNYINEASNQLNHSIDLSLLDSNDSNYKIAASYIGMCDTLSDLTDTAETIVKGTSGKVVSDRKLGNLLTFHVDEVAKGDVEENDTLTIVQLKGEHQLVEGETYLLALERDNYYDENTYHIVGGYQGIFLSSDGIVQSYDENFKQELEQILENSDTSSQRLTMTDEDRIISQLDLLFEYFAK